LLPLKTYICPGWMEFTPPRILYSTQMPIIFLFSKAVDGALSRPTEELCEHDGWSSAEQSEEDQKPKKFNKQGHSDAQPWEPAVKDIVMDSDSDSSKDLETPESPGIPEAANVDNSGIEKEERLVEWCTDCEAESVLTCTTQRHRKLYACGVCVSQIEGMVGFDQFYMRFDDLTSFEAHVQREHSAKPHRLLCTECGIHPCKKDHSCEHNIKKFRFSDCGKRCRTELGLKIHTSLQHHAHVYPCKYCFKPFHTRPNKLTHEKKCSERFDDIIERQHHVQTHGNLNRNICHTCYKACSNNNRLERHMLIHTGQKLHTCQVCQKSFNQKSHLKSHMRLHSGQKPFRCRMCEKRFNHNVSLKNHIRRHHVPSSQDKGDTEMDVEKEGCL
uniref:C2H2-type domain-containing protein n=1 Tax=Esox lucius TaxID=8010 RepID=A0A3P8YFA4_ESOLU